MTSEELVAAALAYADRGWAVFPLVPNSKRPACPAHPAARCDRSDPWCRHGHTSWEQRATRNPHRIRRAWSVRPYGIGIACGPSQLLIVDTDLVKPGQPGATTDRSSGEDLLATLAAHRSFPDTHTVATHSGGVHRYYRAPADVRLGNTAGRLGQLIDTRGHGGYVVAPPTVIDERRYQIAQDMPCAELPTWLANLLLTSPRELSRTAPHRPPTPGQRPPAAIPSSARYVAAALAGETRHVRGAPAGTRNHTLFCAAVALGQLVAGGHLDEHTIREHLYAACDDHIRAGAFTPIEADATITSGLSRGLAHPRSRPRRSFA